MRRKFIQEFANSFCQRVIDLPDGYDLASFAHLGSGLYEANILTGACTYNGSSIFPLRLCNLYREWMDLQLTTRAVKPDGILKATLRLAVEVKGVTLRSSYSQRFASAHFVFECHSEISTDEKTYVGRMSGSKEWGFDWYYVQLYGKLPDTW